MSVYFTLIGNLLRYKQKEIYYREIVASKWAGEAGEASSRLSLPPVKAARITLWN